MPSAKHILNDWNNGKISYFTPVPTEKPHLLSEAEIVTDFAPRFALDENVKFEDSTTNMQIDSESESEIESEMIDEADCQSESETVAIPNNRNKVITPTPSDDAEDAIVYDSEDEVNHQVNQMKFKNAKMAQKKAAKQARRSMQQ